MGILKTVVRICDRDGIPYVLIGGGCLGIARHQGRMIPWDDDLDIAIWQSDLPRFLAAMQDLPAPYRLAPGADDGRPIVKVHDCSTHSAERPQDPWSGLFVDVVLMCCWANVWHKRLDNVMTNVASWPKYRKGPSAWKNLLRGIGISVHFPKAAFFLYDWSFSGLNRWVHHRNRHLQRGIVSGIVGHCWKGRYPWEVVFPTRKRSLNGVAVETPRLIERFLELRYGPLWMAKPRPEECWRHLDPIILQQ